MTIIRSFRMLPWVGVLALAVIPAAAQSPSAFSCKEDNHINLAKKKAIDSAAMKFVKSMLGPNPSGAYGALSKEGQNTVTDEQLTRQAATIIQQFEPKNIVLQHTYFIELKGTSPGRVVCATNLSKSDSSESLAAASVPQQAHVVMSADTRNDNKLGLVVWLVFEANEWKVQSFWTNVSSVGDKDSMQLWQLARTEQMKNHTFNAALLYAAAAQTTNYGPNFQVGIMQSILHDASQLTVPPEIQGQPPFVWRSGQTTFNVMNVSPIGAKGKIYLTIVHEVLPWVNDRQVDDWNKQLLNYFKHRFPEYSSVFAGLVARAVERGGKRSYGTVEKVVAQDK